MRRGVVHCEGAGALRASYFLRQGSPPPTSLIVLVYAPYDPHLCLTRTLLVSDVEVSQVPSVTPTTTPLWFQVNFTTSPVLKDVFFSYSSFNFTIVWSSSSTAMLEPNREYPWQLYTP